jgi:hypothetical protein
LCIFFEEFTFSLCLIWYLVPYLLLSYCLCTLPKVKVK